MGSDRGALVGVDGWDGSFLWARLNPSLKLVESIYLPMAERRPPNVPGDLPGRIVWTPCLESFFSPYFPFAEFKPPSDDAPTYTRMLDGKVFKTFTKQLARQAR